MKAGLLTAMAAGTLLALAAAPASAATPGHGLLPLAPLAAQHQSLIEEVHWRRRWARCHWVRRCHWTRWGHRRCYRVRRCW